MIGRAGLRVAPDGRTAGLPAHHFPQIRVVHFHLQPEFVGKALRGIGVAGPLFGPVREIVVTRIDARRGGVLNRLVVRCRWNGVLEIEQRLTLIGQHALQLGDRHRATLNVDA